MLKICFNPTFYVKDFFLTQPSMSKIFFNTQPSIKSMSKDFYIWHKNQHNPICYIATA